jgi:hypothetical protein
MLITIEQVKAACIAIASADTATNAVRYDNEYKTVHPLIGQQRNVVFVVGKLFGGFVHGLTDYHKHHVNSPMRMWNILRPSGISVDLCCDQWNDWIHPGTRTTGRACYWGVEELEDKKTKLFYSRALEYLQNPIAVDMQHSLQDKRYSDDGIYKYGVQIGMKEVSGDRLFYYFSGCVDFGDGRGFVAHTKDVDYSKELIAEI